MEPTYQISRVNSIHLESIKIGEPDTTGSCEVIMFRHDFLGIEPKVTYTVVTIREMWLSPENEYPVKVLDEKHNYDFGDFHEADSKYQHLCLKFFAKSMAERSVY